MDDSDDDKTNINNIEMSLAERDKLITQIEQDILHKEKYLLDKAKEIDHNSRINHFLKEVQQDYHKYSDAIIEEKQKQQEAMKTLELYINEMKSASNAINSQADILNNDQEKIIKEINQIKEYLDNIK